jgi:hypothetical protein
MVTVHFNRYAGPHKTGAFQVMRDDLIIGEYWTHDAAVYRAEYERTKGNSARILNIVT